MRPAAVFQSYFSQFFAAAMLMSIACRETTSAPVPAKLAFIVQPVAIAS